MDLPTMQKTVSATMKIGAVPSHRSSSQPRPRKIAVVAANSNDVDNASPRPWFALVALDRPRERGVGGACECKHNLLRRQQRAQLIRQPEAHRPATAPTN